MINVQLFIVSDELIIYTRSKFKVTQKPWRNLQKTVEAAAKQMCFYSKKIIFQHYQ